MITIEIVTTAANILFAYLAYRAVVNSYSLGALLLLLLSLLSLGRSTFVELGPCYQVYGSWSSHSSLALDE